MKKNIMCLMILGVCLLFAVFAYCGGYTEVVTASGNMTEEVTVEKGARVTISIYDINSFVGVLELQKRYPEEATSTLGRHVVESWTNPSTTQVYITAYPEPEDCYYRIGCADTFTSGNCTVRIGGGRLIRTN